MVARIHHMQAHMFASASEPPCPSPSLHAGRITCVCHVSISNAPASFSRAISSLFILIRHIRSSVHWPSMRMKTLCHSHSTHIQFSVRVVGGRRIDLGRLLHVDVLRLALGLCRLQLVLLHGCQHQLLRLGLLQGHCRWRKLVRRCLRIAANHYLLRETWGGPTQHAHSCERSLRGDPLGHDQHLLGLGARQVDGLQGLGLQMRQLVRIGLALNTLLSLKLAAQLRQQILVALTYLLLLLLLLLP